MPRADSVSDPMLPKPCTVEGALLAVGAPAEAIGVIFGSFMN
jgi:hypothetical protein